MSSQANNEPGKTPGGSKIPRAAVVSLGIMVAIWLAWTQFLYPNYEARYELTINVETPDGIRTGSSVIEASYGWQPTFFGLVPSVSNSVTGEAVYVDLGDGKNLFVALKGDRGNRSQSVNGLYLPMRIFRIAPHDRYQTWADIQTAKGLGKVTVPIESLPMLVTFNDINDPMSARLIQPDNLSAHFGPGFKLSRATIGITAKSVSDGIQSILPWLGKPNETLKCVSLTAATFQVLCQSILKKKNGKL